MGAGKANVSPKKKGNGGKGGRGQSAPVVGTKRPADADLEEEQKNTDRDWDGDEGMENPEGSE